MVEISLYGSGEGPGWVTAPGYSTIFARFRGELGGLSFYRDRDAAEAGLVIEHPDRLTLVEAKSTQTASTNLFDGGNRVRGHLDDPSRPCEVVVAYGGSITST